MGERKRCWYSIVRYQINELTGETINIGVILHSLDGDEPCIHSHILDENNLKLKAISSAIVEINEYKSIKDALNYYLKQCAENMLGEVGMIKYASPYDEKFVIELQQNFKHKKLFLSEPTFGFSANPLDLFLKVFETYIGKKYMPETTKQIGLKRYLKNKFEEHQLLDVKIKQDFIIKAKEYDGLKIHVDFCYKNGVWNYIQTVPYLPSDSRYTEWFAKTKFLFENLPDDSKIHLMYKASDIQKNHEMNSVIKIFSKMDTTRINQINIDDENKVIDFCNMIEREAHNLDEIQEWIS
jgi:hypothetical protein